MVEAALLFPIIVVMLVGVVDFGRVFYHQIVLAGAVREVSVVFGAAVVGYPVAAAALARILAIFGFTLPEAALHVLAFVLLLLVTQVLYSTLNGWVAGTAQAALHAVPPLAALDRVLGLVPG